MNRAIPWGRSNQVRVGLSLCAGIALVYLVVAVGWFLGSSWLEHDPALEPGQSPLAQASMGIVFSLFSSAGLFLVLVAWDARRCRVESQVRMSEERFRRMSDSAPVLIWLAESGGSCTFFNTRWLEFRGRTLEQEAGDGWREGVHPSDAAMLEKERSAALSARRGYCVEYRLKRSDGEFRWIFDTGAPLLDAHGLFHGLVGCCKDITDRKDDEARQNLLMRELDHRVKNSLAAVLAVAESTFGATRTREEFLSAFTGRVMAMAHTHTALAKGRWSGLEIAELCSTVLEPMSPRAMSRLSFEGAPVMLPPEAVPALGMVLHEMGTNALKYGALSSERGLVRLRWQRVADSAGEEWIEFDWKESGGPSMVEPMVPGLGTVLIRGLIESELGGRVEVSPGSEGLCSRFSFSLEGRSRGWAGREGRVVARLQ